ncbi:MAG: outer membrane beta-barrel domain-containing protein [Bdellovibrionia bacterium]
MNSEISIKAKSRTMYPFKARPRGLEKFAGVTVLLSIFWLCGVAGSFAFAGESDRNADQSDEYSFNWLDPDKKIYVLQNRKYLKAGHPVISLMAGAGFSNPYKITYNLDPRFAYYINETWGVEVFYTLTNNTDNSTLVALGLAAKNVMPQIREIRAQSGAMIHYVPWYAKINVFNNILYFDWYFGVGAGKISAFVDQRKSTDAPSNFVAQDLYGLFLSSGHEYHLSQNLLVRLDVSGAIYPAPVSGFTGDSAWYSNFNFGLGIGWKL